MLFSVPAELRVTEWQEQRWARKSWCSSNIPCIWWSNGKWSWIVIGKRSFSFYRDEVKQVGFGISAVQPYFRGKSGGWGEAATTLLAFVEQWQVGHRVLVGNIYKGLYPLGWIAWAAVLQPGRFHLMACITQGEQWMYKLRCHVSALLWSRELLGVLNIFKSKCLVFAHFWSDFDEIFMTGVKLQIFFRKNIFSPNMIKIWHLLHKNWRAVLLNLKFFIETYQAIPEKTSQNIFFNIPALHGENAIWKLTYIFGIFSNFY